MVQRLISDHTAELGRIVDRLKPEAIVCANDRTAGQVMHSLIELNYQVPRDVRIVGIDDVQYANLLPVPLTTVHQPCREIGVAAVAGMLERIASPDMPTRDILLDCRLVVRSSCGAHASVGEFASANPGVFRNNIISSQSEGIVQDFPDGLRSTRS